MLNATPSSAPQTVPAVPIGLKKAQENVAGTMGPDVGVRTPQVAVPSTGTPTNANPSNPAPTGSSPLAKNPLNKKKVPLKYIIAGVVLLLLLIGGGAALYLVQQSQDVRQRAAYASPPPVIPVLPPPASPPPVSPPPVSPAPPVSPPPATPPATPPVVCPVIPAGLAITSPAPKTEYVKNVDDSVTVTWTPVANAARYILILRRTDNPWYADGTQDPPSTWCNLPGNGCVITNPDSNSAKLALIGASTQSTDSYEIVVQAYNSCSEVGAQTDILTVTSTVPGGGPSPTPSAPNCNEACLVSTDCANTAHVCHEDANDGNPNGGVCRLADNPLSVSCQPAPSPSPSPSPTPTVGCNEACVTNADCSDSNQSCNSDTKTCRLTTNPGDVNCAPAVTPAPGCNETCYASTDCTNENASCYDNLCRLATNPTSTTCQPAATTTTTAQTGSYYEQPALPQSLPQSGSEDILNWLKVGLGVLGLGLIFLFL